MNNETLKTQLIQTLLEAKNIQSQNITNAQNIIKEHYTNIKQYVIKYFNILDKVYKLENYNEIKDNFKGFIIDPKSPLIIQILNKEKQLSISFAKDMALLETIYTDINTTFSNQIAKAEKENIFPPLGKREGEFETGGKKKLTKDIQMERTLERVKMPGYKRESVVYVRKVEGKTAGKTKYVRKGGEWVTLTKAMLL